MNKIATFGFHGTKDCGKTSVMSQVITKLADRGYRVAAVKHTRGKYSMEREGTDTYLHGKAGAGLTVFSSPVETSFMVKEELGLKRILDIISSIDIFEIVLLEGYKHEDITGIDVGDKSEWSEEDIHRVVKDIEKEIKVMDILRQLPHLDCGKCGHPNCEEMARAVTVAEAELQDCTMRSTIRLRVNGEPVELGEFPADIIKNAIAGMVESLKGVEDVEHVHIEFSKGEGP